ncbi:endonuclease/exonuclease/phosphatase family protein [Alkalimarinus alittae]|uniref:Endonuclease/exonuclease/phosphatase family protein n=1 Tax=Alkalimarinus alittae TaxID=2961619 RepID=A0ABY6N4J8_9ALTE|nr:endonuclease/exonuclease/phosphatase family protein [Alkalimarinus alittae]UZE96889.1 endonuclease/exonuclease/phosphatase family protein [Alkalimarinus alittae]
MNTYNTHFNVCTFNLFNYVLPPNAYYETENIYTLPKWEKKQRWIAQQLSSLSPDIIGFQEVFSPDALKTLVAQHNLPYFVTVSEPQVRTHHVYEKPVVALASRFPILTAEAVEVSSSLIDALKLQSDFNFSRPPIRAEVQIEGFGSVLVYVAHLKSKRSQIEPQLTGEEGAFDSMSESVTAQVHGSWASTIQRGTEATLIYQDIIEQMRVKERPVMVLGDLNDSMESPVLQSLVGGQNIDRLDGKNVSGMAIAHQRAIQRFSLYDAFDLQEKIKPNDRKPTHYFANRGNVLDYILLSKDFKSDYDHSLASVNTYQVNNAHLINPHPDNDAECSDHAPVQVDIEIRV